MVIALNMMDEVRENGGSVDVKKMSEALGAPVGPISAAKGEGLSELTDRIYTAAGKGILPTVYDFCDEGSPVHRCVHAIVHIIEDHAEKLGISARFCASKLIESDNDMTDHLELDDNERQLLEHCIIQMENESGLDRNAALADMRYTFIENVVKSCVKRPRESKEHARSVKMDRVLTGKYTAIPVFLAIMGLIF